MSEEQNTVVYEQEEKANEFHLYKLKSSLHIENWLKLGKVMLKIAPAAGDNKGQPQKGETRYNYDEAINIGFSYQDLLKCSYKLMNMAYGEESIVYNKFADLSKVEGKNLKGSKKLHIAPSSYTSKGQEVKIISINLSLDDKKVSIALDYDEAYALAKHFEFIYQYTLIETIKKSENFKKDRNDTGAR
jgi:hypothetical protein